MRTLERLGADDLASVVVAYRDALRSHQESINRLNVYPVPDGDTGTNMALTLESVVAELPDPDRCDLGAVCAAVSHGSLMGARGNSGVILSQILRGIAEAFRDGGAVGGSGGGGATVADALARATAGAYQAVMRPVEGTILSVVKAASAAASLATSTAVSAAGRAATLVEVLDAAKSAASTALARTPDQLPVLKAAGVVDAGGAGFVLLLDAFLHRSAERPLPAPDDFESDTRSDAPGAGPPGAAGGLPGRPGPSTPVPLGEGPVAPEHDPIGDLRYEVMYFLEAPDASIGDFRAAWAAIGDSIVVVGGDGLWNCHIHTDDIGAAIEAAVAVGRPRQIRVTDLLEQVEEQQWVRDGGGAARSGPGPVPGLAPSVQSVVCAAVAVATGEGIRRIFRSLGVQHTVAGGQTMNPSTAQLLAAIDAVPGREVILLPNNKNIIPVAEQAARIAAKPARVVPTRGIAEGFAALLAYDPQSTADQNAVTMAQAAARVVSGEITTAVRASTSEAGPIRAGDFLGLSGGVIEVVAPKAAIAACRLLAKLLADDHEIVTIIEGEGATAADTRSITDWLAGERPDVCAEVHKGGQPLYPYLLSIE